MEHPLREEGRSWSLVRAGRPRPVTERRTHLRGSGARGPMRR